jgi:hypothetical protein
MKDLLEFETNAPFLPRTIRKSGQTFYFLRCANTANLQQSIRDHMPEYEPVDVLAKLADLCKTLVPGTKLQFLEKDGDRLICHSGPLDAIFGAVEINVLNIINQQLYDLRTAYPDLHDVFPHDQTDSLLLIPNDLTYIFSRHANNPLIDDLGSEFEMGMALLHSNTVYGPAILSNANRLVHLRDQTKPTSLPLHFPGTAMMHNCLAINIKALENRADPSLGILALVPCFSTTTCMIATGKQNMPERPATVTLTALSEPFTITNPHHVSAYMRGYLPSNETSVVEKEFFGTEFERVEIPPGPITELYLVYMRSFVLWQQLPLLEARPDFIAHYLKHGHMDQYEPFLPGQVQFPPTPPGTGSILMLFQKLARKCKALNLVDDVIASLLPRASEKRKSAESE